MAKNTKTTPEITIFETKHGRDFLAKQKKFAEFPDLLMTQKN